MDKDILNLLPQKAFKLISIKETLRIGSIVTKSALDKKSYDQNIKKLLQCWKWSDVLIATSLKDKNQVEFSKDFGEKILKIYFSQFFEKSHATHLDLRSSSFDFDGSHLIWVPSKLHYKFSDTFQNGIRFLYSGFYLDDESLFEQGLVDLGMLKTSLNEEQKKELINIFYLHFGEGKNGTVKFSLSSLQSSFNVIFLFFLREDIPLNPEFAVLGINLVTLYLTLEKISEPLDVCSVFLEVNSKFKNS